jgi:hypothetical protein
MVKREYIIKKLEESTSCEEYFYIIFLSFTLSVPLMVWIYFFSFEIFRRKEKWSKSKDEMLIEVRSLPLCPIPFLMLLVWVPSWGNWLDFHLMCLSVCLSVCLSLSLSVRLTDQIAEVRTGSKIKFSMGPPSFHFFYNIPSTRYFICSSDFSFHFWLFGNFCQKEGSIR